MAHFKIRKGYAVPITGEPKQEIVDAPRPPFVGVCPTEFPGVKPRLAVSVDDRVKVGTPLFAHKKLTELQFVSPASGKVTAINYGPRRVIEEIIIATDNDYEHEAFPSFSLAEIRALDRDALVEGLMKGGMWPLLRQRPFGKIPLSTEAPKAIFVNAMNTAPLANDPNFSLDGKGEAFEAGVAALSRLSGKTYVCARGDRANAMFTQSQDAECHQFSGKHPAGLVGTHITKLNPLNKGERVWHLNARDAVAVGEFLLGGRYPVERVVAVAGPGCKEPRYVRTQLGVKIKDLVGDNVKEGEQRFVSGDALSGAARPADGFLGFYDDLATILPEGRDQDFLGWMSPGAGKPSISRVFLSALFNKKYDLTTNLNGSPRAIVQSGIWDGLVALDVYPEFLIKATIAQDIDQMERLGILECAPEDFALCTYACPSKTEASKIIAEGLELMEKEG